VLALGFLLAAVLVTLSNRSEIDDSAESAAATPTHVDNPAEDTDPLGAFIAGLGSSRRDTLGEPSARVSRRALPGDAARAQHRAASDPRAGSGAKADPHAVAPLNPSSAAL